LLQLTRRTAKRVVRGTELWHGNRETIRDVFSRESIFLWALQTHRRRRREFAGVLASTEYGQLSIVRLRSPREARSWLSRAEAPADART
jgi:hypothetical protein